MGLLKKTDASALAREAMDAALENAAGAEHTVRIVVDSLAEGQSVAQGVSGASSLYAEIFSLGGAVTGTMSVTGTDGVVTQSFAVNSVIASRVFALPTGERYVFRFVASGAVVAARLLLCAKGGAFFAA